MLALIVGIVPLVACGGGPAGPTPPTPTPGPTPTPTVWVLQNTREFNVSTGTFGFSYPAPPIEMKVRRMVVKWGQLPAGIVVTGRFLINQDAIQTCYNANFVCGEIVPPTNDPTENFRGTTSQTVTVPIQTLRLFPWVVATGGTPGVQTTVSVTVELYSSL